MDKLPAIKVTRKIGNEPFHALGEATGLTLLQFWQWAASDLTGNALRGQLAEFIVTMALDRWDGVRTEWDAFDILTATGIKIEVKSAAYIQSWEQKAPSVIRFDVRPTQGWHAATNEFSPEVKRQADVYVFALLMHMDQRTVDPLNLAQWKFHVIGAHKLDRLGAQKSLSLSRLKSLGPIETDYDGIADAVGSEANCSG